MKEIVERLNSSFPSPAPPALLRDDSAGRISRELWWTNHDLFLVDISPWLSMLMYHLGDEK
jgi:hypothetical protein